MAGKNVLQEVMASLAQGLGEAVTDVRQKVVEQPWFGQSVTPTLTTNTRETQVMSLDEMAKAMGYQERGQERERDQQEHER